MTSTTLRARLDEVERRAARGMEFGLDRMRLALANLGEPQDAAPAVHIAGTNGKGSTSAAIAAIAGASGREVGLYTSPHLCRIAERIRLNGEPIGDAAFERALGSVLDGAGVELTFFETLTAAAFVAFRDARVDLAVIEVGLGGRLDATNTMRAPLATAITSIDLDHTAWLGGTRDLIAREKAGIFRPNVPVVLGSLGDEARAAALDEAQKLGAGPVTIVDAEAVLRAPPIALEGAHQRANAATAEALARALEPRLPGMVAATARGLATVKWPGRFERIARGGRTIILDCAHNPEGARALGAAIDAAAFPRGATTLVFGALVDKAWPEMLRELAPRAARVVFTSPKGRPPAPFAELAAAWPGEDGGEPIAALSRALAETPEGGAVVVAGSSYLIGELTAHLYGIAADPIIAL